MFTRILCLPSRSLVAFNNTVSFRQTIYLTVNSFSDDAQKKSNLYQTLGIKPNATKSEIEKAYLDLTFKYRPDRNENSDFAANKFREVSEAYEILGNYRMKKMYDTGVPLSMTINEKKKVDPHNVKYQSFYDSRAMQSTSKDPFFMESEEKHETLVEKQRQMINKFEEDRQKEENSAVPFLIMIFICVMFMCFRSG